LANEWDRAHAIKRGGRVAVLPLDFDASEARYGEEPSSELTPEALFERQWALAVLDAVLARLRDEQCRKGQGAQFESIKLFLTGDQDRGAYERVASALHTHETALRTAVHRLRRRYAELVREELAAIVGTPDEVEDEIRFLLTAVARG